MQIVFAAAGGFVLDLLLGDPAWLPHPVVLMGRCITFLEPRLRRTFPQTCRVWRRRCLLACWFSPPDSSASAP